MQLKTMSRDKQVEEMARDLENHTCMSQFQAEIASKMLYAKGYRKASEVAREIFEELEKEKLFVRDRIGNMRDVVLFEAIDELKKKYTKEERGAIWLP